MRQVAELAQRFELSEESVTAAILAHVDSERRRRSVEWKSGVRRYVAHYVPSKEEYALSWDSELGGSSVTNLAVAETCLLSSDDYLLTDSIRERLLLLKRNECPHDWAHWTTTHVRGVAVAHEYCAHCRMRREVTTTPDTGREA